MATPYQVVYGSFLQKIKNYAFVNMAPEDVDSILKGYLVSGIPRFKPHSIKNLDDRDDTLQQFTEDLSVDEIEILSTIMVLEHLKSKIYVDELLKQGFTNKEWNRTSQANHLEGLVKLKEETERDIEKMVMRYAYSHANFDSLQ